MKTTTRTLVAAALAGAVLLGVARAQEKPKPDAKDAKDPDKTPPSLNDVELGDVASDGPVEAAELLNLWGARLRAAMVIDEQMRGMKLPARESDQKTTWGSFKKILDFHDIVIEENDASGHLIVFAHLRRNIPTRVGPPFQVIPPNDPMPARDAVVTAFVQIKHGAGNDIFATVRGLLVRDVNRIGNILYVRGPEVIIIVDFASNCAYYKKIMEQLDVEGPQPVSRVFRLEHAPAEDLAKVVRGLFGPAPGVPVGILPQVVAEPRSNRLVVRGTKEQVDEIQALLVQLDVVVPPLAHPQTKVEPDHVLDTSFGLKLEDEGASSESARILEVVPGSLAAKREIRTSDRIVALNGERIVSARALVERLAKLGAEDAVTLRLARGDWQRDVKLVEKSTK